MTLEELKRYVDDKLKEAHKNCTTNDFHNGVFWALKDIQQKLLNLQLPTSE